MATVISGKELSSQVIQEVAGQVADIKKQTGKSPALAVVLVGEDPASQVYVRNKIRTAKEAGITSIERLMDENVTQDELNAVVDELNADPSVNGILVQLPLPKQLDDNEIIRRIAPEKDVDGFHPLNVGALAAGQQTLVPCTPLGCLIMLKKVHGDLSGMNAVVVGRSNIVGKPMAALLLQENCTVTIVHSRTKDLPGACQQADILVAAVGIPAFIQPQWVKPGATVIDVGINASVNDEGKRKLVGDVAPEVEQIAGAMTPVPGGVGPMTIACLMKNTLTAAEQQWAKNSK